MGDATLQLREIRTPDGALPCHIGGAGPVVILSHSFGRLAWGPLGQLARSCTVVVPAWEQADFGAGRRTSFAWLDSLLAELGAPRAALCVWSMAGPPAIEFTATSPATVSHLILVDVAGFTDDFFRLRLSLLPHVLLSRLLGRPTRGLVRGLWKGWVHSPTLDARPLHEAMHRFLCANPFEPDDDDDDEEEDEVEELLDTLAEINRPTLILTGRHSPVLGPEPAAKALARLSDGRLEVFENSSHVLQLEEPERFQQVVAGFVS